MLQATALQDQRLHCLERRPIFSTVSGVTVVKRLSDTILRISGKISFFFSKKNYEKGAETEERSCDSYAV